MTTAHETKTNELHKRSATRQFELTFNIYVMGLERTILIGNHPGLGFNGVVIDLQHHFEIYANFQNLPKSSKSTTLS